eukprot:scaffold152_cov163-Amphora_coffeaeformis.AAC.6
MEFRGNRTIMMKVYFLYLALASQSVLGFVPVRTTSHRDGSLPTTTFVRSNANAPLPTTAATTTESLTKLQMWSNDEELRGADRFKACVPYILPLLDGDQFGYYIYDRIPPLGFLNDITIGPLAKFYHDIPFLGIGLFLALTLGTRFNTDMDRTVRFNAQQAALIDVCLIFPELIASGFVENPVPRSISEPCANFVWYAYMFAIGYSIWSNLRGRKPDQIPYVSPYADFMVGPF